MPDYDVVVIGAGNGGLTAAAGSLKMDIKSCCSKDIIFRADALQVL